MDYFERIKQHIMQAETASALELLTEWAKESPYENDAILLKSRYNGAELTKIRNTEPSEVMTTDKQKIDKAILDLAERILKTKKERVSSSDITRLEIVFNGNIEDFTEEKKQRIKELFGEMLELGATEFRIGPERSGSVILPVDLPTEKAGQLMAILESGEMTDLGISEIKKIFKKEGKKVTFFEDQVLFLQGVDLRGVNLQGLDLQGVDLQGADLSRAELQGVKLWVADLKNVDLQEANLQGADLWKTDLQGARLWAADLQDVDLQETKLKGVDFSGS